MTPLMPHENSNRIIEGFVVALCEEFGLEFKRAGSLQQQFSGESHKYSSRQSR